MNSKHNMNINLYNTVMLQSKQTTGLTRNTIDKYYTSDIAVNACVSNIKQHIYIQTNDIVIEPSAGNGSFITSIKDLTNNSYFYDLEPEDGQITRQDYLQFDPTEILQSNPDKNIHIIGNPPFGHQSSIAIRFIKKSCMFCNTISFILPRSFKKDSMKKHFPLEFHLIYESDLPENSFMVDNKPHNVPCVFQIWEKRQPLRDIPVKLTPEHYTFVSKTDNPDISFRRVGVYAGKIDKEVDSKSPQSHYFIKFIPQISNDTFDVLCNIHYECKDHTVGPKSISKQELIKEFNKIL